jgi:hypothetical protein
VRTDDQEKPTAARTVKRPERDNAAVDAIPIADEVARSLIPRKRLGDLGTGAAGPVGAWAIERVRQH